MKKLTLLELCKTVLYIGFIWIRCCFRFCLFKRMSRPECLPSSEKEVDLTHKYCNLGMVS